MTMDVLLNEYLSRTRGSYSHGYFYIFLTGDFDTNLSHLSIHDQGLFFHEYVHFLQNITTLWGIKTGMIYNDILCDLFTATRNASEIHVPFDLQLEPKTQQDLDFLNQAKGSVGNEPSHPYKKWMIDTDKPISERVEIDNNSNYPCTLRKVFLDVTFQDGRNETIQLGSTIVVESMAALCQIYIDPDAEHDDVPYNVVQILANQKYPHIAGDKKKLICLCYIALFSLDPGWCLLDMMRYAECRSEKSAVEIFDYFVAERKAFVHGSPVDIPSFFDFMIDGYIKSIEGLISIKTDYLKNILNGVRLSDKNAPLISILEDTGPIRIEQVQQLVDYLAIPFVYAKDGYTFVPTTENSPQGSSDVAILVSFFKMFEFLMNPRYGLETICPFVSMCPGNRDHCYSDPWNEVGCFAEIVMKKIGLFGKQVIIN